MQDVPHLNATNPKIASGPLGRFSRIGCHFGAKSSFRAFVDKSQMPDFEYHSTDIVRRGEIVRGWSRFDPVREVQLLHPNSLGSFTAKHHINPEASYRDILLWMGERCDDDFGYVWDSLRHSWNEQKRPALVTCEAARKLSNHCKDFFAEPVFDVDSEIATHSVRAFRLVREMLDSETWQ